MKRENKTKYAVLGALSFKESNGYGIKSFMQETTDYFWREGDGSIYPILQQLLAEGLISYQEDSKVYSLTSLGRESLEAWLERPPKASPVRSELLLKIFFGENTSSRVLMDHIHRKRLELLDRLSSFQKVYEELEQQKDQEKYFFTLLTLRAGILDAESSLQWCKEALEKLEKKGGH